MSKDSIFFGWYDTYTISSHHYFASNVNLSPALVCCFTLTCIV